MYALSKATPHATTYSTTQNWLRVTYGRPAYLPSKVTAELSAIPLRTSD